MWGWVGPRASAATAALTPHPYPLLTLAPCLTPSQATTGVRGGVGGGDDTEAGSAAGAAATTDSTLLKKENMLGPEFGNHTTVRCGRPTSGPMGWWGGGSGGKVVGW